MGAEYERQNSKSSETATLPFTIHLTAPPLTLMT